MKQLKRDYIKDPLKYGEEPFREDVEYLYLELNLTATQIQDIYGINKNKLLYYIKIHNLRKTHEQIQNSRKQQWKMYSNEYKEKRNNNIKNAFKNMSEERKNEFRKKVSQQRHNCTEEGKLKRIEAFKNTWNKRTVEQENKRRIKISEIQHKRTPEQKEAIAKKFRITFKKVWQNKPIQEKVDAYKRMQETKKIRGTFNSSSLENEVYNKLLIIYPKIIRQYKSDVYPFACDFYIIPLDLYIEINFNWTHGKHAFNPQDKEDLQILNIWQQKALNSKFYKNAIEVWTIRDPKKLKIAKENNLNYLCFYTMEEFNIWYDNISKLI